MEKCGINLESIPLASTVLKKDLSFSFVSEYFCRLVNYSKEELLTISLADLTEQRELLYNDIARLFTGEPEPKYIIEIVFRKKGGEKINVQMEYWLSYQDIVAVFTDITSYYQNQHSLQRRIDLLTQQVEIAEDIRISDLFEIEELQRIQDVFSEATGVASIITHPDGTPITKPSNFCALCNDVIRKTRKGLTNCYYSDAVIGRHYPDGPIVRPCFSGGLLDAGSSITVGGKHIANWLIGQVKNESTDDAQILAYAKMIGADEIEYKKALAKVPVMSKEQFEKIAATLYILANDLSFRAYQNILQTRLIIKLQQTQKELKNNELLTNSLVEHALSLIEIKALNGTYLLANKQFELLFNIHKSDMIGKKVFDFFPSETATKIHEADKRVVESKRAIVLEESADTVFGKRYFLSIRFPIFDADKNIFAVGAMSTDITERKRSEEELKIAKEKAEESDRLKSAFMANISHEIRTPMNGILGFSEMMNEDGLSPLKRRQYADIIKTCGSHLLTIIDDLIDIARIEANELAVKLHPVRLNDLLTELFSLFKAKAESQRLEFSFYKGTDDPAFEIITDGVRLRQILMNLIGNAFKFTHQGYVKFGYQIAEGFLHFTVEDTGIGIASEKFEVIFQPFRQAVVSTERIYGGTGLGLSISKALVSLLGGKISVQSELNKKTVFHFIIPYVPAGSLHDSTDDLNPK